MNNNYPNPWEFSNTDKEMLSPNQEYKIEFYNLNEIATELLLEENVIY